MLAIASEGKLLMKLDQAAAYNQIRLREEDQYLTRTRVSDRLVVQARRLQIGDRNGQTTAQAYANKVYNEPGECAFIDDAIIALSPEDCVPTKFIARMRRVVEKLLREKITLNADKCIWLAHTVVLLGHVVSHKRITPLQNRIQTLHDMPPPGTKKELTRFLALARWYTRHIPNLSILAATLTSLLSPKVKWEWTIEHQKAYTAVQDAVLHYATLSAPIVGAQVIISVDASKYGMGYVVEQQDAHGACWMLFCGGRKFTPTQFNYTIPEKEVCVMKEVITKHGAELEHLANGRPIIIYTDNQTAAAIRTLNLDGKSIAMRNFVIDLQHRNIEIRIVPGAANPVADACSRVRTWLNTNHGNQNLFLAGSGGEASIADQVASKGTAVSHPSVFMTGIGTRLSLE